MSYTMIIRFIVASLFAALAAALFIVIVEAPPSTPQLDSDLAALRKEISVAKQQSGSFNASLIKSLIEARIEILASTEAMLVAKRESILRRINLSFRIDGSRFKSTADLAQIQKEIAAAQKRVAAAELEASKYSGGLLQALILGKAATENLTVAQLNSAYYSAKYGLPTIGAFVRSAAEKNKSSAPVGQVVRDKDAL